MNRHTQKRLLNERIKNIFLHSFSAITVLILWEIASKNNFINSLYFPAPSEVISKLFYLFFNQADFLGDIWASTYRLIMGSIISIPVALILGVAIGLNKYVDLFFKSLIAITYPIPKLAIFPLLLVIFGIGDASKIAMIAIGIFFLVLLNTIHGVERVFSSGYFDIVLIYRIPFWNKLFRVVIRGALPEILNGIKIGMGYGLVMVVAGEFSASRRGVGCFMWNAWDQFRIKELYCGLIILSLLGLIIFVVLDRIKNNLKGFKSNISG
jgi:ABC-type nitrate/sulfonate/bicarbonate transport system permease component